MQSWKHSSVGPTSANSVEPSSWKSDESRSPTHSGARKITPILSTSTQIRFLRVLGQYCRQHCKNERSSRLWSSLLTKPPPRPKVSRQSANRNGRHRRRAVCARLPSCPDSPGIALKPEQLTNHVTALRIDIDTFPLVLGIRATTCRRKPFGRPSATPAAFESGACALPRNTMAEPVQCVALDRKSVACPCQQGHPTRILDSWRSTARHILPHTAESECPSFPHRHVRPVSIRSRAESSLGGGETPAGAGAALGALNSMSPS